MKKSCKNIDITDIETIEPFVEECLRRHKKRWATRKLIQNKFGVTDDEYNLLLQNDAGVAERIAYDVAEYIADAIKTRTIPTFVPTLSERHDKTTIKARLIGSQPALQQFFDYVAVRSCAEIWRRRFVPQQCSSIKGRGQIYGAKMIRGYIRKDNHQTDYAKTHGLRYTEQCKYFVKLDVKKCYPSMDKALIMQRLSHDCGNLDILYLWQALMDSYGRATTPDGKPYTGLLIGALPSQWISQLMISFIYRYVMNHKDTRNGKSIKSASHMVIFMDDMLIFASNKRRLKRLVEDTILYAKQELHLTIKPDWAIQKLGEKTPYVGNHKTSNKKSNERSVDMMGFVVHKSGKVSIRSRNFVHMRRLFLRFRDKKNHKFGFRSAYRLVSYKGFFLHSCHKTIQDKYGADKIFKAAQKIVSRKAKAKANESTVRQRAAENQIRKTAGRHSQCLFAPEYCAGGCDASQCRWRRGDGQNLDR